MTGSALNSSFDLKLAAFLCQTHFDNRFETLEIFIIGRMLASLLPLHAEEKLTRHFNVAPRLASQI